MILAVVVLVGMTFGDTPGQNPGDIPSPSGSSSGEESSDRRNWLELIIINPIGMANIKYRRSRDSIFSLGKRMIRCVTKTILSIVFHKPCAAPGWGGVEHFSRIICPHSVGVTFADSALHSLRKCYTTEPQLLLLSLLLSSLV